MLRLISHLVNATMFISLAALAWNVGGVSPQQAHARDQLVAFLQIFAPGVARPGPVMQAEPRMGTTATKTEAPAAAPANPSAPSSASAAAEQVTLKSEVMASRETRAEPDAPVASTPAGTAALPLFASGLAQKLAPLQAPAAAAAPATVGPAVPAIQASGGAAVATEARTSPAAGTQLKASKPPVADVIVPPIRRQKPTAHSAPPRKAKAAGTRAAESKKAAHAIAIGVAAFAKRPIDLSGRSTLGAGRIGPAPVATAPKKGTKMACKQGLRFDGKLKRCMPLASPTAATSLRVRGASATGGITP